MVRSSIGYFFLLVAIGVMVSKNVKTDEDVADGGKSFGVLLDVPLT